MLMIYQSSLISNQTKKINFMKFRINQYLNETKNKIYLIILTKIYLKKNKILKVIKLIFMKNKKKLILKEKTKLF